MITLNNIKYSYNDGRIILDKPLSCTIQREDRVAILGENGTGKTTLLKIISKYMNPSEGLVEHEKECKIAFIPSNLSSLLLSWYSVGQNIAFYNNNGSSLNLTDEMHQNSLKQIECFLDKSDENFLEKRIHSLSGGEKAVVSYIIAKLTRADLIILDEIFANTSNAVSYRIIEDIIELKLTIIFTSHTPEFIKKLSLKQINISDYLE